MAKQDPQELGSQEHAIDPKPEEIAPLPGQTDEGGDARLDAGAESTYSALPNHTALIPTPGEAGAPDDIVTFRVTASMVSVPHVFLDSEGKTGVTAEGKYLGEIVPRRVFGDEQRIAHLLGLKAIEPYGRAA